MRSSIAIDPQASLTRILKGEYPDARGRFGPFGGRYVPETLVPALDRLQAGVDRYLRDRAFLDEFHAELRSWVGRPTPLTHARTLSQRWGAEVWLKREDLAHTGAHKINNSVGQVLLAKKLGAKRVIAETGAGQHGVASAAACARLGMPCTVYMGSVDMERQAPNVGRMKLLGATVVPVTSGDQDAACRSRRSIARLGLRSERHLLLPRLGDRPAPVSVSRTRAAIGDRPRSSRTDAGADRRRFRTS